MIVKNSDIALNEASSILENAVYLTESEAAVKPITVPVIECSRLNTHLVNHKDIQRVAESYDYDPIEAVVKIAEANRVNYNDITVSIDEADLIMDPYIVYDYENYAIAPIAESWEDQAWFDLCLHEAEAEATGETPNPSSSAENVAQEALKSKKPNIIARAIARLRKIYKEWMLKIKNAEEEYSKLSDNEKKEYKNRPAFYKRIAAKILGWIDRLTSKLQYMTDRRDAKDMSEEEISSYKADAKRYDRTYDKFKSESK